VTILSEQKRGAGLRWSETREVMGKEATETMEMASFEENRSYVVTCDSHGTFWETTFTFEERDGGTQVTCRMTMEPRTLKAKMMKPMMGMMRGMMEKCMNGDFEALKAVCESDAE
jgi:hypothetical protein